MDHDTCFEVGSLMAKMHTITANKVLNRTQNDLDLLLNQSYIHLANLFDENLAAMSYLRERGTKISGPFG